MRSPTRGTGTGRSPDRLREPAKQRVLRIVFGMPLDGQRPRCCPIHPFDALDDAVLRPRGRAQRRGQVTDRLMVAAVDARAHRPEGAMQQGVRLDAQPVASGRVGVIDRPPAAFAREVLVQRPAQGHVQDLDAATDGEDGEPAALRAGDERELDGIAGGIGFAEPGMRRGAIARRVDVLPAGEHQPLHPVEGGARGLGVEHRWHQEGHEAGAGEGAHVRDVEGDAFPTAVGAARRAHRDDFDHGVAAGEGEPRSGQLGWEPPRQPPRTPYSGMVLSPPLTVPSCGYDLGGRCPSYKSTPWARWLAPPTTSGAEPDESEGWGGKFAPWYAMARRCPL